MNSFSRYSVRNRHMNKINRSIKKTEEHLDEAAQGFLALSNMLNKTITDLTEIDESSITYVAKEERLKDRINKLLEMRRETNVIFTNLHNDLLQKELLYKRLATGELAVRSHSPRRTSRSRSTRKARSI